MREIRKRTLNGAAAGGAAAAVWAAQTSLDKKLFGHPSDDVELLGKALTRGPRWRLVGLALHLQNGALFGAVYANVVPRVPLPPWSRGPLAAMIENFGLWPLTRVTDRFHPARAELPRLAGSRRALAQATWRHLIFGLLLGELERRLNAETPDAEPVPAYPVHTNGHGAVEHATAAVRDLR
jgi:hypothetical protein